MLNAMRYSAWAATYGLKTKILRRDIPFIGGLVLNDSCNLHCAQCRVANTGRADLTFDQALGGLYRFREMGIRSVAITGGEPFHWTDGERRLEDVVKAARTLGFLAVAIYTNGTYPIESSADAIMLGMDGGRDATRRLRSDVFDRVMENVRRSNHRNIHINFTINAKNRLELDRFLEMVEAEPHLGGVFFNFHTPYYGKDELFLGREERVAIARRLVSLKRHGSPILNSRAALRAYIHDEWKRPSTVCQTFSKGKIYPCCRENANPAACRHCGYLGYLEVLQVVNWSPSAILEGFNYLKK
ncbi:radical SAM protein [Pseudodesulfovibrio sp.]|uniref:radical SAM protein n=1 Tax=Pseudodesulfovibrio sp. TaxID=2035812 RepID=UPI002617E7FD|nr:radical SAM protein [Pseudodesulfovibrio sp.]MDD3313622.1 radical SAM protein [Pseudodesulfovibrio sp.]